MDSKLFSRMRLLDGFTIPYNSCKRPAQRTGGEVREAGQVVSIVFLFHKCLLDEGRQQHQDRDDDQKEVVGWLHDFVFGFE